MATAVALNKYSNPNKPADQMDAAGILGFAILAFSLLTCKEEVSYLSLDCFARVAPQRGLTVYFRGGDRAIE
jgi:hypothetical protein